MNELDPVARINSHRQKLGLDPSEVIRAVCIVASTGSTTAPTMTCSAQTGGTRGGGRSLAERLDGDPDAPRKDDGRKFFVLTAERLIAVGFGRMFGTPTELVASWPREEISAIEMTKRFTAWRLIITFCDGSTRSLQALKGFGSGAPGFAKEAQRFASV